ncbi:hypothetical protein [Stutzerimonas degradans]
MTKHDLKELAAIGAELGAAKAEVERLRGLLRECHAYLEPAHNQFMRAEKHEEASYAAGANLFADIDAALSQQAEPTDAFTAADMINQSAQAFRDGQAAVEQAPAQDEREPVYVECRECTECGHAGINDQVDGDSACSHCLWHGPSPDEDKCPECQREWTMSASCPQCGCRYRLIADADIAAHIAQTAPQPAQGGLPDPRQWTDQHPDDAAVDRFAAAMKAKLAAARAKGRGGWDDPNVCSVEFLAQLLVEHLGKGNTGTFEDVANFAMMLHQRGADPKVLAEAAAPHPEQSGLYTCIGKGGSYELIGRATTAGVLKVTGRFADDVIVYRDTESSELYCREPGDFRLRMARTALSAQGAGDADS